MRYYDYACACSVGTRPWGRGVGAGVVVRMGAIWSLRRLMMVHEVKAEIGALHGCILFDRARRKSFNPIIQSLRFLRHGRFPSADQGTHPVASAVLFA